MVLWMVITLRYPWHLGVTLWYRVAIQTVVFLETFFSHLFDTGGDMDDG